MRNMYLRFLRGVSANFYSRLGATMVTSSFIVFIFFELLWLAGALTNAYIGLITYLALPTLFIIGLLLIPFGWVIWRRKTGRTIGGLLSERFSEDDLAAKAYGAKLSRTVVILTLVNLLFLGLGGMQTLHFMDQPRFCGTACHSVMNPEWTTYQASPHAHVKCVECHVGEGVDALVDSKINGLWQMISLTFDLYDRPIPTPVRNLRPARETCEKCHWPDMFHGNRVRNIVHYDTDSASTPRYTTLLMKIGSGKEGLDKGSHWHVSERNQVRYASIDNEREEMIWVDVRLPDGSFKRYCTKRLNPETKDIAENVRIMDCVDCHNRATHIYQKPEWAVDERMSQNLIGRKLPYIKREALGALLPDYPDKSNGNEMIDTRLRGFYTRDYPNLSSVDFYAVETAVNSVKEIYQRNIHPRMKITWGSYPSHLGHRDGKGCFRCHNTEMVDEAGNCISMECTLCHSFLAYESDDPYRFLKLPMEDESDGEKQMREYLLTEIERGYELGE